MTEPVIKKRRRWGRIFLITIGVFVTFMLAAAWYTTTTGFRALLHDRIVAELQKATGGRVELGSFHTIPFRMRLEARDLTLHGTEASGALPLAHVDRIVAQLKLISLFSGKVGLEGLVLDHPVIHVELADDGTSNIPVTNAPTAPRAKDGTAVDQLMDLAIRHLEVQRGELIWNDQQIPLNFSASDVTGSLAHALFRQRYDGKVHVGKADTKLENLRPFSWSGDLEFALTRQRLEVKSLDWASGRSKLHFSGEVLGFLRPQVNGHYAVQVDVADLGSIVRLKELAGGHGEIEGDGKWSDTGFAATGKVSVRDGVWKMQKNAIRVASGSTLYSLTDRLELRDLQMHSLGGTATGDVRVDHWLGTAAERKKHEESVGLIRLKLRDLAASDLLGLLDTPDLPLNRLHAVGSASGTLETTWKKNIKTADTDVILAVSPPAHSAGSTLPLSGTAHGVYRGVAKDLDLPHFDIGTSTSRLEASGTLGSKTTSTYLVANTSNLAEWVPIINAFRGDDPLTIRLDGRGNFTGNVSGDWDHTAIAGKLDLTNFGVLPRNADSATHPMRWGRLALDVQASRDGFTAHHGILRQGSTQAEFDGQIGLQQWSFTNASPVSGNFSVRNAGAEELQSMFGYSYRVSGRVSLLGEVAGTRSSPHGQGLASLHDGTIYGETVPSVEAKWKWAGHEIAFDNLDAEYASGRVVGSFAYNLDTRVFRASVSGSGFELSRLPKLRDSQTPVGGNLKITASGSGTWEAPTMDVELDFDQLAYGEEKVGGFHIVTKTRGEDLQWSGQSQFERGDLALEGKIHLRGNWPSQSNARFLHLDMDPLLQRYLRGRVTGHSSMTGTLSLGGPLRIPRELDLKGELSEFHTELQNVKLANDGPIRFRVADQVFQLEETHFVGDNTQLAAGGIIHLTGSRDLDVHASGQINLGLLQTLYPDFITSGTVNVQTRIVGTVSDPVMQGKVTVANGGLAFMEQPASLSDINGTLVFTQDRLQIEQLTARSGGGIIHLGGYMQYGRFLEFNVTAKGDDLRLRYPPGMSSTASADLRLYGTANGAVLSGELQVTRFNLSQGFDFGSYVASNRQSSVLTGSDSLLNRVKFDLHIYTTPDLRFSSSLARVSGDADLRLRGTMAKPVLLGRANIQEGEIYFNGAKYQLERGDISFTNPVKIDPVLDLAASIRVRDYDIELGFHGTSEKLNVTYRSEPPLPQADIIALLALGRTQEESARAGASQSAFTQEASNAILGQAINATVSSRVQKLFGVSRIKIDPQSASQTTLDHGPQVTIEQQVSNKLTLTYVQPVSQATQQTIQAEYDVTRNVSIVAARDQNGVFALDIRIRQRKR